jgi:uncharacterized protein
MMSPETMETLIRKAFDYAETLVSFAFQGGEPTLAGLDFFREFIRLVRVYNRKVIEVQFSIQTNGVAITSEWADFLLEHRFLVGLSLDGPAAIHDYYRKDAAGQGSFAAALEAARLFKEAGTEFNILLVVNDRVARCAKEIYQFYKKQGFRFLQFIPCLDPLGESPGGREFSLKPERYARFMMDWFDLWYKENKAGRFASVRTFDNWLQMALGYPPEACAYAGQCAGYFVVEADGSIYPCDFYVTDEWLLGNIQQSGFMELGDSPKALEFLEISRHVDPACRECTWFKLCRGGCRRNREPFQEEKPVLNQLCPAYREFFEYSWERFHELGAKLAKKHGW